MDGWMDDILKFWMVHINQSASSGYGLESGNTKSRFIGVSLGFWSSQNLSPLAPTVNI